MVGTSTGVIMTQTINKLDQVGVGNHLVFNKVVLITLEPAVSVTVQGCHKFH